ncbi:hypothetical protein [Janthinobacterium sp. HH107]|uniref:hypothetical protein n=1 Tax=Janthinobacterium sp. HH107 TaxID=1537279 RepID=UPI00159F0604|nr:hypothetical protein [Janthinobacterium sp. HH107]
MLMMILRRKIITMIAGYFLITPETPIDARAWHCITGAIFVNPMLTFPVGLN